MTTQTAELEASSAAVRAWADEYVPFEPRTASARALKQQLADAIAGLSTTADSTLMATLVGRKPGNADVENLLLYNLGARPFTAVGAHRIVIEHEDRDGCIAPSGRPYRYGFFYRLADQGSSWQVWRAGRPLASWREVSLGAFRGEKKLEQVWSALRSANLKPAGPPKSSGEPFLVSVSVRPPAGAAGHAGRLFKGVIDGVVSALQADTQSAHREEAAPRIAAHLGIDGDDVAGWMADNPCCVLGEVRRLVRLRAAGVQWSPSDHDLVAADVTVAPAAGAVWTISGSVHTALPASR